MVFDLRMTLMIGVFIFKHMCAVIEVDQSHLNAH